MIRRVAFGKAVFAGATGALAWEVTLRVLILAGVPLFDLVYILGTMVTGRTRPWQWWPIGMALHATVGAIWSIFYAYFFWSTFDLSPPMQGLIFSLGPTILAGLIMVPQMDLMLNGASPPFRVFAIGIGMLGPVSILLGHLIYGVVLGSIYVRPVGYSVGKRIVYG